MKIELGKFKTIIFNFVAKFISKNSELVYLILKTQTGLDDKEMKDIEEAKDAIKKALKNLKNRRK